MGKQKRSTVKLKHKARARLDDARSKNPARQRRYLLAKAGIAMLEHDTPQGKFWYIDERSYTTVKHRHWLATASEEEKALVVALLEPFVGAKE